MVGNVGEQDDGGWWQVVVMMVGFWRDAHLLLMFLIDLHVLHRLINYKRELVIYTLSEDALL